MQTLADFVGQSQGSVRARAPMPEPSSDALFELGGRVLGEERTNRCLALARLSPLTHGGESSCPLSVPVQRRRGVS